VTENQSVKKPNLLFILADNVGCGDFGCYNGNVPTPRIDALAAESLRFRNYNVEAECTPTRSAIMTGRMPVRSGTARVPLPGEGHTGLCPWEYTIANLLSDAGYATALYGKWHLGNVEGRFPTNQGFYEWWGIPNTADEAGYTAHPLFAESGLPAPQVWEGVKGQPSRRAGDFDLQSGPSWTSKSCVARPPSLSVKRPGGSPSSFMPASRRSIRRCWSIRPSRANPAAACTLMC
jgi:arylsulfatase A-like enzyme